MHTVRYGMNIHSNYSGKCKTRHFHNLSLSVELASFLNRGNELVTIIVAMVLLCWSVVHSFCYHHFLSGIIVLYFTTSIDHALYYSQYTPLAIFHMLCNI